MFSNKAIQFKYLLLFNNYVAKSLNVYVLSPNSHLLTGNNITSLQYMD